MREPFSRFGSVIRPASRGWEFPVPFPGVSAPLFVQPSKFGNQVEEGRNEKYPDEDGCHHAADDPDAYHLPRRCARSRGYGQRKAAHDKGDAGHQDGAQADSGRIQGGREQVRALTEFQHGEFHDEDGIFGRQSNQDDEADFRINVQVQPGYPQGQKCSQDGNGGRS